ncbi:Lrp/AsnC family transcriptional regulator [Bradyrhizobium sp. WSM 1704]|uniref:Lrp/AsnC family transcriptional regulator n=1 Tax=Bradyrhizobium semiaridum TaxID=2821404 RepID=UPI001CE27E84|nr:Lrp/AsnC family transcriptional regulator [Bradyrhizobium semiaridum]MCA6121668.1 Lrp/AsnC family transcriptional regulator [Bradyrhizobium semiaridum]
MTERQQFDDIDLKILSQLQTDGRMRINELAARVGITAPPCLRRVRALRGRGVIQAVRATLDERQLGYEVTTFVLIQLDSQTLSAIEAFEAAVAVVPRFLQCWRISGDADFMLRCVAPSVDDMRQQLLQFAGLPNVRKIRSFPVLGVSKDAPLPIPGSLAISAPT